MSSEGIIFAPKPIRNSATAQPLKPTKSIGFPNIHNARTNNKIKFNNFKNNIRSNQKNSFSELASEMRKKSSNSTFAKEKIVMKNDNFVSFHDFQSEIDNEFNKQSATLEILSILSNSKRSFNYNYQSNFFNNNFDCKSSISDIDYDYIYDENEGPSLIKFDINCPENYKRKEKIYNLKDKFDSDDNSNNDLINFIFEKNKGHNNNKINNNKIVEFLIDLRNQHNINKEMKNHTITNNAGLNKEKGNDLEFEISSNFNNLIQNAQSEIKTNNTNVANNLNKLPNKIINNFFNNLKEENIISDQNEENNSPKNNSSNFLNKEVNKVIEGKIDIRNNQKILNKNSNKQKSDSEAALYNNNYFTPKKTERKYPNNTNNIIYFLDENFFLELENENLENYSFTTSFKKITKNNDLTSIIHQSEIEFYTATVPIRCKNPFLKSLKSEGFEKINKFFENKEITRNKNILIKTHKPVNKFLFSENSKIQRKIL
jgi:hypothetical protein